MTKKNVFQALRIELKTYEKQLFLFVDKSNEYKKYKDQKILDALAKKREEFRNDDKLLEALEDVKSELLNQNKSAYRDRINHDFERVYIFFSQIENSLWDVNKPNFDFILKIPIAYFEMKNALKRLEAQWEDIQAQAGAKPKIKNKEANLQARNILKDNPTITIRDLAKEIGCSTGLVSNLPAWKAVQGGLKENRKQKTPKIVSLTTKLEKTLPQTDTELEKLIKEQKEEQKSDEGNRFHKRKTL